MNLRKKYFHSIHSYMYHDRSVVDGLNEYRLKELKYILYKFECILKCGNILPYAEIEKLYGEVNRNLGASFNKEEFISVSRHEDNPSSDDIEYKEMHKKYYNGNYYYDYEDAFEDFILLEPSIVLNGDVKELKHIEYPMIYLERLFREPIPLDYMCAISIDPKRLTPFFEEVNKEKYLYYLDYKTPRDLDLEFLNSLRKLLTKYGYDVPIIDINTGNEFHENKEYHELLVEKEKQKIIL